MGRSTISEKSEDHILLSVKARRARLPRGQRARHVTP